MCGHTSVLLCRCLILKLSKEVESGATRLVYMNVKMIAAHPRGPD